MKWHIARTSEANIIMLFSFKGTKIVFYGISYEAKFCETGNPGHTLLLLIFMGVNFGASFREWSFLARILKIYTFPNEIH